MKKSVKVRMCVPLVLGLFVAGVSGGCSRDEAGTGLSEIRLGVQSPVRGTVNTLEALSREGDKIGIYGAVTASSAADVPLGAEWGGVMAMSDVRTAAIDPATGAVSWNGIYYYPAETDRYVKFCAYYPYAPQGTEGAWHVVPPSANSAPVLHFTLTGQEDLLWTPPVVGGQDKTPAALTFRHQLTRLRFRFIDESGDYTGETVGGISFNGVNTTGRMNIETGALDGWGTPSDAVTLRFGTPVVIGAATAPADAPGEVMLQPGQPDFSLKIETSWGTYPAVSVHPSSVAGGVAETNFAAGRSYLITVRFRSKTEIALSASVTPWEFGGTGEVDIQ